jgi:para-nitrobenzyl esterase
MAEPIVETAAGKVAGREDDGVRAFKGIPYAAPPVGEQRFRPPARAAAWAGVRPALEYGPSCPQLAGRPDGWAQEPSLSEDCLYLNVWTPTPAGAARPVMVWMHGGGYSLGSGSWPVYDGAALARRGDVVVVTLNHRLGIFGYLHLAEIAGDEFATSGNAGMLDLVAALEWVRDNIAAFGGDPANVTIFGESGGGAKVSTLHAMPSARGLFHRAIIQSGPGLRVRSAAQATQSAKTAVGELGIDARDHGALAALTAEQLLDVQRKRGRRSMFEFSPVRDGIAVTGNPADLLADGSAPDVPVLIGCNRDEATLFLAADPAINDPASLEGDGLKTRLAVLGEQADAVIGAYRAARPEASARDVLLAIESDRMMRIPSIELAERKIAGRAAAPVFMYLFRWATGPLGSAHGFEIPFVFDNARPPIMKPSESRTQLAGRMSDAWIAFARAGDPSHAGLPAWPPYSTDERSTMIFDRGDCHIEQDPGGDERRGWANAGAPTGMPT